MGKFFAFWRQCVCLGARGSVPFANDWQWTIGNPTVAAMVPTFVAWLAVLFGESYVNAEHPILAPLTIAAMTFAVTWLFALIIGALRAEPRLYHEQKDRVAELTEQLRPKISCCEIAVKEIEGQYFCRVSVQNASSANLSNLTAKLEEIIADDALQEVAKIDFPIPLFTQERLKDRIDANGLQPVMPFSLRGNEKKWIEVFQVTEPFAWQAHLFLSSKRVDFIAVPGMVLKCGVYGAGKPIHFTITYNETDIETEEDSWSVKLMGTDGSETEVRGYPQ